MNLYLMTYERYGVVYDIITDDEDRGFDLILQKVKADNKNTWTNKKRELKEIIENTVTIPFELNKVNANY